LTTSEETQGELDVETLDMLLEKVKEHFAMEFINRIDEIIVFNPLGLQQIKKIVDIKFASIAEQLAAKGLKLELGESAKEFLARKGFSRDFGARYLQRTMQKELANPLSDLILKGEIKRGDKVEAEASGDTLAFKISSDEV
jgi:ATP-dependent Clp protease ATP-binding subunit ClpA